MKNRILNSVFFLFAIIFGLVSCEDRELVTVNNQSAPVLIDLSSDSLILSEAFPGNPSLTVTWEEAGYSIPVEVNYRLEVSDNNTFAEPVAVLGTLNRSENVAAFTAVQINNAAAAIGLEPGVTGTMFMRVVSYLGASNEVAATSNVTSLLVRPYSLTYPDFYLVGEASVVGWNAGDAQHLYKHDKFSTIYTYMENGKNFRFLGQQDWNPVNYSLDADGMKPEYKYFKQWTSNMEKAGEDDAGENIKFTGETGIYKITINADKSAQTIEAVPSAVQGFDFAEIYMVGTMNGWSAGDPAVLAKVGDGIYEITLALDADAEFKLLGQKDWADLEWGNILADNHGYSGYLGPKGDNGNIKFAGDGGDYKVTVNLKRGTITITK